MTSLINFFLPLNVAIEGHCYATFIKTDIHLIAFDRLKSGKKLNAIFAFASYLEKY